MSEDGFLSRWARRKADVKAGREIEVERAAPDPVRPELVEGPRPNVPLPACEPTGLGQRPAQPERGAVSAGEQPPAPTLDDVDALKPGDAIARFVARDVDETVKRAALKKLFADPHFNIMDGLDTYIDDYGKPDPIPMAMLRQLNQAKFLNLFAAEEAAEAAAAAQAQAGAAAAPAADLSIPAQDADATSAVPHADEDPDLQLQPDDPARP